jgi:hypothetical protein
MTPKQEYHYGVTKDFIYDQYFYEAGSLYKTGYLYTGHKSVGWFDKESGYYRLQIGSETWMLHRLIWIYHYGEIPEGKTVDHRDHDRTNNKIENLRLADRSEQNKYQRKRANCSSQYIGLCWRERVQKYEVTVGILVNGKNKKKYIGSFHDEVVAAKARDRYVLENKLTEWNLLNFLEVSDD